MTASGTEERPIAAWMQVLDEIEGLVVERLALMEELAGPSGNPTAPATPPLQILDERLAQMQMRMQQAAQDARDADTVLGKEVDAYQRWTETMAAARRGLADWAAAVGRGEEGKRGRGEEGNG